MQRSRVVRWCALAALAALGLTAGACGGGGGATIAQTATTTGPTLTVPPNAQVVSNLKRIFETGGTLAEDGMYACLVDALAQRIPYMEALKLCETKTLDSGLKGFGDAPFDPVREALGRRGSASAFDPETITTTCASGTPEIAQGGPGWNQGFYTHQHGKDVGSWGYYSWGEGEGYKGLTKEESLAQKAAAVAAAETASDVEEALVKAQTSINGSINNGKMSATTATTLILAVRAAVNGAAKNTIAAQDKALADPNKKTSSSQPAATTPASTTPAGTTPGGTTPGSTGPASTGPGSTGPASTTPGSGDSQQRTLSSACEEALQQAREFLYECNRSGWKHNACAELQARMHRCPSPSQILVDPDQGYVCGDTPDVLGLVVALRERCQQLKRGVDGQDPCAVPQPDSTYRGFEGEPWDPCTDPAARVDPESGACAAELVLPKFGEVEVQKLLVYGLNTFGGGVWVIPQDPNPPGGGRGPEPKPPPPS